MRMDLKTFISDIQRRELLADRVGKSSAYMYQLGIGFRERKPSPQLAAEIENATRAIGPEPVMAESMCDGYEFTRNRNRQITGYSKRLAAA